MVVLNVVLVIIVVVIIKRLWERFVVIVIVDV